MRRFHAFSLSKKKKKQTQKCEGHLNSSRCGLKLEIDRYIGQADISG